MSLGAVASGLAAGLQTPQTGLGAGLAGVGVPGSVRRAAGQIAAAGAGQGSGLSDQQVRRTSDRFLLAAGLDAASGAGAAGAAGSIWSQAQTLFGDPSSSASLPGAMDQMAAAFSALSAAPNSGPLQSAAVAQVGRFFNQTSALSRQVQDLGGQADSRIGDDVATANNLLQRIDALNADVARGQVSGQDGGAAQTEQAGLIGQLSTLIDVKVAPLPQGGVSVRTTDGALLAGGAAGPAQLNYAAKSGWGQLSIISGGGQPLGPSLTGGQIKGYLDLRNTALPAVAGRLSDLVDQTAQTLNAVHSDYSAAPAPAALSGRDTDQELPSAIEGFAGSTTVAIVDAAGAVQRRVDINFDTGTMSVNGVAATGFTPATFQPALNAALGGLGSASFANGALTLTAANGNGVATADVGARGSRKAGRDFSDFFGLNDLVRPDGSGGFSVRSDIAQDPPRLATTQLDLSAAPGTPSLAAGDTRGALALSQAGQMSAVFEAVGGTGKVTQPLSDYAVGLAGFVAHKAASAGVAQTSAETVAKEAATRRTAVAGVSLDQELGRLTSYQQAHNSSTRMIQAARDMQGALLGAG